MQQNRSSLKLLTTKRERALGALNGTLLHASLSASHKNLFWKKYVWFKRKILIRNCGYYKPRTMGTPGCHYILPQWSGCLFCAKHIYNTYYRKLSLLLWCQTGLWIRLLLAIFQRIVVMEVRPVRIPKILILRAFLRDIV